MKTTSQIRREAKALYQMCVVNGIVDEGRAREIVERVIDTKSNGYLTVLSHFHRLLRLNQAKHAAKVETAVALPADLRDSVQTLLTNAYGSGMDIRFAVKSSLIGGMRIQAGSDVYDGSVQAALAELAESF
jgi:F-type H+-transporting ATPase subunit delta